MAASLIIEEESGKSRSIHPHNGYYAGDFSGQPVRPMTWSDVQWPLPALLR